MGHTTGWGNFFPNKCVFAKSRRPGSAPGPEACGTARHLFYSVSQDGRQGGRQGAGRAERGKGKGERGGGGGKGERGKKEERKAE
jgi:hypothetical protein